MYKQHYVHYNGQNLLYTLYFIHQIIGFTMFTIAVGLLCVLGLFVSVFPSLLVLLLRRSGFSAAQIEMYNLVCYRGILLQTRSYLYGIDKVTLYIPQLKLSVKWFGLCIVIPSIQVFLSRSLTDLNPIHSLQGMQQAKILDNYFNHILKQKEELKPSNLTQNNNKTKNIFIVAVEGFIQYITLNVLNIISIDIASIQVYFTSGIQQEMLDFSTRSKRRGSILLMKHLTEYLFHFKNITQSVIMCDLKQIIMIKCSQCLLTSHYPYIQQICQGNNFKFQILLPYSLSISEAFIAAKYHFQVEKGTLKTVPMTFQQVFKLIQEIKFDPFGFQKQVINQQQSKQNSLSLVIGKICIELNRLSQNVRNKQAMDCLSNIDKGILQLSVVSLNQGIFTVKNTTLSLSKFFEMDLLQNGVWQKDVSLETKEILRIPSLIIDFSRGNKIQIKHQQVNIFCQKEEISLLGKIFQIINSRIRFQQYDQDLYAPLLHLNFCSTIDQLIIALEALANRTRQFFNILDLNEKTVQSTDLVSVVYQPQKLTFQLRMTQLLHKISLSGLRYQKDCSFQEDNHKLFISSAIIQYKEMKQFIITSFQMKFRQDTYNNELYFLIDSIKMQQNQFTLIDYLDSFTLMKYLLQFELDTDNGVEQIVDHRINKKIISIDQIFLSFNNQQFQLTKLRISKQSKGGKPVNQLSFELSNCNIYFKQYFIQRRKQRHLYKHCLLSVQSVTVQTIIQERHRKMKQKYIVQINKPVFNIPQTDVSNRITFYVQIFDKIQSHFIAYMKNVTNDNFQHLKIKYKQFLQQFAHHTFIINNFSFRIEDTIDDIDLLNYHRTIRNYLVNHPNYNQIEAINALRRNAVQSYDLLRLKIQKIHLQLGPIQALKPQQNAIYGWLECFEAAEPNERTRLRRVHAGVLSLKTTAATLTIRDYPTNIFQISQAQIQCEYLYKREIFSFTQQFIKGQLVIGQLFVNAGLCHMSGINQINKKLNKLVQSISNIKFKNKRKNQNQSIKSLFNLYHGTHWNVKVKKQEFSRIKLLTSISPYNNQGFDICIGSLYGRIQSGNTNLTLGSLTIDLLKEQILRLSNFEFNLTVKCEQNGFKIVGTLTSVKQYCFCLINDSLIQYILAIKQFRRSWLIIYGWPKNINQKNKEIISNKKTLFFITQTILNAHIEQFYVLLNNKKYGLHFLSHNFKGNCVYNKGWRAKLSFQSLIGKIAKCNELNPIEIFEKFQQYWINKEVQVNSKTKKKFEQNIFFVCTNIQFYFSRYIIHNDKVIYTDIFIQASLLKAILSQKIKLIYNYLEQSSLFQKLKDKQNKRKTLNRKQFPIQIFKRCVQKAVIVIRKQKAQKNKLKRVHVFIKVKSTELSLRTNTSMLLLQSNFFTLFVSQPPIDYVNPYNIRTIQKVDSKLYNPKIFLIRKNIINWSLSKAINEQIMNASLLTLTVQGVQTTPKVQTIQGRCSFQNCQWKFSSQTKNILIEIIKFIIDLVNSKQVRNQILSQQKRRYAELREHGKKQLKTKIEWKQCDLMGNLQKQSHWIFELINTKFALLKQNQPFLKMDAPSCKIDLTQFNNTFINFTLTVYNPLLTNIVQMTKQNNPFSIILQMKKQSTFQFKVQSFQVQAYSTVLWKYFKNIQFIFNPITVHITDQLEKQLKDFFFKDITKDEEEDDNETEYYRNKLPQYIKRIHISPIEVRVWYRSSNFLKRMSGVRATLNTFELESLFQTRKEIFNRWLMFLAHQFASQVFSLIGQKIFGGQD